MAKYKNRNVKLNVPFRTSNSSKKFAVYVRDYNSNQIKIVRFGAKGMSIKRNIPSRQKSFFARFRPILANVKGQKNLSPAYWAIKSWQKNFKI